MKAIIETIEGVKSLVVTIPVMPRPSSSGKTLIVASSNGNVATTATHEGKPIIIGLNAYVK